MHELLFTVWTSAVLVSGSGSSAIGMDGFVTAVGANRIDGGIALVRGMIGRRKYLNLVFPDTASVVDTACLTRGSMPTLCDGVYVGSK